MSIISPGRRKIHYTFPDETEMVEEYDVSSGELLGKLQLVLNMWQVFNVMHHYVATCV